MNSQGSAPAEKASPCLARQPILTKDESVLGYELLFRQGPGDRQSQAEAETAITSIIDTLNVVGFDAVCDGRLAFINCTEQMLLKEFFLLLPADRVVLEFQDTMPADASVCGACLELKQKGYRIALDNFTIKDPREPLVLYADFLKVDIRRHSSAECRIVRQTCRQATPHARRKSRNPNSDAGRLQRRLHLVPGIFLPRTRTHARSPHSCQSGLAPSPAPDHRASRTQPGRRGKSHQARCFPVLPPAPLSEFSFGGHSLARPLRSPCHGPARRA